MSNTYLSNKLSEYLTFNTQTRKKIEELVSKNKNLFTPMYDLSLKSQKFVSQERLKKVLESNIVSIFDFEKDPNNIFSTHEMLSFIDQSACTKFTVQFNLFGGSVLSLGTEKHRELIKDIDTAKITGCFCLTEVGYGNNAVEMESTAKLVFSEEYNDYVFELNTPTVNSEKFWITNGAYYAQYAVFFAQTYIPTDSFKKELNHEGINAFLVRLRDEKGNLQNGVTIDDMGSKQGMNGVDNARIRLKNVVVSKDNLLDNITKLISTEKGFMMVNNSENLKSKRDRFLAASNRLLSGRICISCISLSETKICLATLNNYAESRLSNGKSGKSDFPIKNFQLYSNQITPLIVKTLVLNTGLNYVRNVYSSFITNKKGSYSQDYFNHVVRLCCVIKPLLAWHNNDVSNICRERSGGMGYLSINRIENGIAVAHSAITAEGDSAVLMQKVCKEYVDDFSKGKLLKGVLPFESDFNNLSKLIETKKNNLPHENYDKFFSLENLHDLLKLREVILLNAMCTENKKLKTREEIYDFWMNLASNNIQELSEVFGERICIDEFVLKLIPHFKDNVESITKLNLISRLFCMTHIKKYLGFYVLYGLISNKNGEKFLDVYNSIIKEVSKFSNEIIGGFNIPSAFLNAPISTGFEKYYNSDSTDGEFSFTKQEIDNLKKKIELRPKF